MGVLSGKVVRLPFGVVSDASDDTESHSLSERSQMIILAQTGYLHWTSRYYKEDGNELTDTEREQIEDWASKAEDELLVVDAVVEEIPAPYWDQGTDAGDQALSDEQMWYGGVSDPDASASELTFVQNLFVLTFAGFLVYAGDIGAAIAFYTIAPRFVLAWERGDIGEIWRVVVDSVDYARVDTTANSVGDVVEVPVSADLVGGGHDILLVKVG